MRIRISKNAISAFRSYAILMTVPFAFPAHSSVSNLYGFLSFFFLFQVLHPLVDSNPLLWRKSYSPRGFLLFLLPYRIVLLSFLSFKLAAPTKYLKPEPAPPLPSPLTNPPLIFPLFASVYNLSVHSSIIHPPFFPSIPISRAKGKNLLRTHSQQEKENRIVRHDPEIQKLSQKPSRSKPKSLTQHLPNPQRQTLSTQSDIYHFNLQAPYTSPFIVMYSTNQVFLSLSFSFSFPCSMFYGLQHHIKLPSSPRSSAKTYGILRLPISNRFSPMGLPVRACFACFYSTMTLIR